MGKRKKTTSKKTTDIPRSLTVHLTGAEVEAGKVSISLFTKTLSAFQLALYDIGDYKLQRKASIRGRKPDMLRREAELFLSKTCEGSYTATVEFRKKSASLFPELRDVAEELLRDLKKVLIGIGDQAPEKIKAVVSSEKHRSKLLRDLLAVTPSPKAKYGVAVRFGRLKTEHRLLQPDDEFLRKVGGESLVAAAKEEFQEAIVHARCSVRRDSEGNIRPIGPIGADHIIDYTLFDELDNAPFEPKIITSKEGTFTLVHPLKCKVHRDDNGLIVIECDELRIRSYAYTREEAENLFYEEFCYMWHEYAEADDTELSQDAIELKKVFCDLVKCWE